MSTETRKRLKIIAPPPPPTEAYFIERLRPVRAIFIEEAEVAGITWWQLIGHQRSRKFAWPRQYAIWRAYRETTASTTEIARVCGMRDHTTILHAIKAVEARMLQEDETEKEKADGSSQASALG